MFWKQMYDLEVDKLIDLRITCVTKENPTHPASVDSQKK